MLETTQPVLFIGHGNPMHAIDDNPFKLDWQAWGQQLRQRFVQPRAILLISAHWQSNAWRLTESPQPQTIHDFGGFPPQLYAQQYPAPGAPELLPELQQLLPQLQLQGDGGEWGLDHGCWTVLMHLFPQANVPVVQLSMPQQASLAQHYAAGQLLADLSQRGILIIGSGNTVHNFALMRLPREHRVWHNAYAFDAQVAEAISSGQHHPLYEFASEAEQQRLLDAHPSFEHYAPLLYAAGAGAGRAVQQRLTGQYAQAPVGMRCVQWG